LTTQAFCAALPCLWKTTAMPSAMKKVMKKVAEKKQKAEKEIEEDDSEDEEEEDSEEEEEEAKEAPKSVKQDANAAKSQVAKKQRVIDSLHKKQNELVKKLKAIKDALRKEENEMEELKSVASKKKRALNKQLNEKQAVMDEKKAKTASRFRRAANKRLKSAQKSLNAVSKRMRGVKGTAEDTKMALKRASSKVDELTQQCKALRAKGEHVPDNFQAEDFSSPHAWKPPGYVAAKALEVAKEVLAKAQAAHKKADAEFQTRDVKRKAVLDKMDDIKKKRRAGSGA